MEELERVVVLETKVDGHDKDIHILYKKTEEINSINTAIALLTSSINELKSTVNKLNEKLDSATEQPTKEKAKLWDTIIKYIIGGLIALAFGFVGAKFGISK